MTGIEEAVIAGAALLLSSTKKVADGVPSHPVQADIESLGLNGDQSHGAKGAAYLLRAHFPSVVFTSGKRDINHQTSAMAADITQSGNRRWIADTYKASPIINSMQAWVDAHPNAGQGALAIGLLSVAQSYPQSEWHHLSWHLVGDAFDVRPGNIQVAEFLKGLAARTPGSEFLSHEGGLTRYHFQVPATAGIA